MIKANSNFAVNLAEMPKEATIHFCLFDELIFQTSALFNHMTIEYTEINCVNIGQI